MHCVPSSLATSLSPSLSPPLSLSLSLSLSLKKENDSQPNQTDDDDDFVMLSTLWLAPVAFDCSMGASRLMCTCMRARFACV